MIRFDRTIFNRTTPNVWRRWIDMKGISIRDVCLRDADLSWLDLRWLDLQGASLLNADLSCTNLRGVNLHDANLHAANLQYADLNGADLQDADLNGADLTGANLRGADLTGADLRNAKLDGANMYGSVGFYLQCPETGAFIGWKRVGKHIIKLQITEMALRSSATGRKCRCSEALVLSIDDGALQEVINYNFFRTVYKVGEVVRPDRFDTCRWKECTNGIHFFITRKEAEEYCC
jgi:uncharacterized protein YjbI with pentapeptide repeats